jgi:hypothetical protein
MEHLQRADPCVGVHTRTLSRPGEDQRPAPRDGYRHPQQHVRDPGEPAAGPGECAAAGCGSTANPRRTWRFWATSELIIGGGFDTTTALTAHALEWLGENADQRERLSRERDTLLHPATEEFLRFFTPAPGDGRTFSEDMEFEETRFKEGERLWISWAMANRDPSVFHDPNEIILDRKGNRHFSFGIGVHRCVGSNVARSVFKSMLTAVLDRMPEYVCDSDGTVH